MSDRIPHNARWVIVSVNKPIMARKSDDEIWLLNPHRRYILNADTLEPLKDYIDTMSDLQASPLYRPLISASRVRLPGSTVLIERYRDRGIGDLLFTTSVMAYFNHVTGGDVKNVCYAYAERGAVLNHCPYIAYDGPLVGPILYDDLPQFNFHWFLDTVTEFSEEKDQLNVYDALFHGLGIDPASVDPKFKRPVAQLSKDEKRQLDDFFFWVFNNTKPMIDLRKTGYYVVAPFANSPLRSTTYTMWLNAIEVLSRKRPVLVVGALRERMPVMEMSAGDFVNNLEMGTNLVRSGRVINLLGKTQVRNLMQIISKANCAVSLDSAPLYIAEAFRVPCVSLWGTHDPAVRIGYDKDYMDLAIWEQRVCAHSPCFAWAKFPESKCPSGESQRVCACMNYVSHESIIEKVEQAENRNPKLIAPVPVK